MEILLSYNIKCYLNDCNIFLLLVRIKVINYVSLGHSHCKKVQTTALIPLPADQNCRQILEN